MTAAFDRVAEQYDRLWTTTPAGRAQRDQVWRRIDPLLAPGLKVLDVGCGTGEDAAHMAAHGAEVLAIDASPAMIEEARRRGGFAVRVHPAEEIVALPGSFDGALSNFGALNCVDDLAGVAHALGVKVRPGGWIAICTIGRFCAWEVVYYAARLQFGKAFRRLRGQASSSMGISVRYPTVGQLRAAFAPDFELRAWTGIGVFVAPSYVRLPSALVSMLAGLDRAFSRVFRALADHRLLIFVRKPC